VGETNSIAPQLEGHQARELNADTAHRTRTTKRLGIQEFSPIAHSNWQGNAGVSANWQ